jgi:hypothetical protein
MIHGSPLFLYSYVCEQRRPIFAQNLTVRQGRVVQRNERAES